MKKHTIMFAIACLSMAGLTLNAAVVKGKKKEKEPQNDPLNAVVRVEVVSSVPNYTMPWQTGIPQSSSGSGVVIKGNQILTNAHNVADSTMITIRKQNEDTLFIAKVKFVDHECDLALLSVEDPAFFNDITPPEFAETPPPQSVVVAAGFPMGGDGLSLTQGIISRIEVSQYAHSRKELLAAQIDAAINPGNSGGPVFYDGKVVGIAFQGINRGENLGYMIPYEIICHFLEDIKDGKVNGFGKLYFKELALDNPDTRASLKMKPDQTGIFVRKILNESDGNKLHYGDVILSIDGNKIANNGNIRLEDGQPRHFSTVISSKQVGESVNVELLRDGDIVSTDLIVEKKEEQIESYLYDRHPEYYIIGGLVFTRLTYSYLQDMSTEDYSITDPIGITERIEKIKDSPDNNVVVLARVLGDEVNVGYQALSMLALRSINGQQVHSLREVVEMVESFKGEYITFEFGGDMPVTLNIEKLRDATPRILDRYRISADRFFE